MLNEAIEMELYIRNRTTVLLQDGSRAQAQIASGAQAQVMQTVPVSQRGSGNPVSGKDAPMYPEKYAVDNQRIQRKLEADELGIKKPTLKDMIKAEITNAYAVNDLARARREQDYLEAINARERAKRATKKRRKSSIAKLRYRMNSSDPNSDAENNAPA